MAWPRIFHWPTPWFWGAICLLVLFASRPTHPGTAIPLICVVVIAASILFVIRERRQDRIKPENDDELSARLRTIENRLTDTQDVMIALSEKIDRMEEAGATRTKEVSPQ